MMVDMDIQIGAIPDALRLQDEDTSYLRPDDHGYCRKHLNRPHHFRRAKWPAVVAGCSDCQYIKDFGAYYRGVI